MKMKYFYKVDENGYPVSASFHRFAKKPEHGFWRELSAPTDLENRAKEVELVCWTADDYIEFIDRDLIVGAYYQNIKFNRPQGTLIYLPKKKLKISAYAGTITEPRALYINNEIVHTFTTSNEQFDLVDYDVSELDSIGFTPKGARAYTTTSAVIHDPVDRVYFEFGSMIPPHDMTVLGAANALDVVHNWLVTNNSYDGVFTKNVADNTITFTGTLRNCEQNPTINITTYFGR